MTVEENLLAVLETLPLTPEQRRDRVEELLAQMGLEGVRNSQAYVLSGGERRRLEIARSLVLSPSFVLLDEPFSGIDPLTVVDIQKIIADLSAAGIGVLVTDHNVRETLAVTNRAYIITEGKILFAGTPAASCDQRRSAPDLSGRKLSVALSLMNWLQPKLHLRVAQKQILTPGLVQMVSVLALNRLELREMINQEIMANPVLEELPEEGVAAESYTDEAFLKKETEKVPETEAANPFDEFDFGSFFTQYLDTGAERAAGSEHEEIEKPSFDKFLSSPASLADHLTWQLSVSICTETVRKIAEAIIGNLDENGYLMATLDEIAQSAEYSMEDVEEALAMVQEFDPPGIAARDLQECLLMQLKVVDPQNTLAQQIIAEHLKLLQNNQTERSRARPESSGRARETGRGRDQAPRSQTGAALQQNRAAPGRARRPVPQSRGRMAGLHE